MRPVHPAVSRRAVLAAATLAGATALPAPARGAGTPLKVLTIGDSITYGWPEGPGHGYQEHLSRLLAWAGVPNVVVNKSVPGATTADIMPWAAGEVGLNAPDITVLCIGLNDAVKLPSGFESRYRQLLAQIAAAGPAGMVTAPCFLQSAPAFPAAAVQAVNDAIFRSIFDAVNGQAVLKPGLVGPVNLGRLPTGYLRSDGVHPTADGYRAYAYEVFEVVGPWLHLPREA
jgi:lysophospholipase L1-like esterase